MRNKLLVLGIVGITLAAGTSSYFGRQYLAAELDKKNEPFQVATEKLVLNEEQPTLSNVGALSFIGGWALTADNDDFGGFSGMVIEDNGKKLVAISDQGDLFHADIDVADENLFVSEGKLQSFAQGSKADKIDYDAESIIKSGDGYIVSFEQKHRLMKVTGGTAVPYTVAADLSDMADNGGLEAIAQLKNGDMLLFAEHGLDVKGALPAWITNAEKSRTLRFLTPDNYSPTDAAALPNGDVLLLMRHFSALDGVSAKVMLIKAADIEDAGDLTPVELAHLEPPFTVDNMEAMDIVPTGNGGARIYMMSDDNFSFRQRTLFMVFDWQSE